MNNRAKSLREIQRMYGLSYERVRRLVRLPGFPLIEGVVFPKDFDEWRKEYYRNQHIASVPPPDGDHKAGESIPMSGLRVFAHLGLAHQLAEVLSLL